jgi:hypothetical protein
MPTIRLKTIVALSIAFACSCSGRSDPAPVTSVPKSDPVVEFRELFNDDGKTDELKLSEGAGWRVRRSPRIDVRRTDSLVSPLIGVMTFDYEEVIPDNSYLNEGKFTYAYQEQMWVLKSIEIRVVSWRDFRGKVEIQSAPTNLPREPFPSEAKKIAFLKNSMLRPD